MNARRRTSLSLPAGIWALGFVSLAMDVSSELIHSLLPVFLVTTLGASAVALGILEGASEATAQIVKVFSGAWSDRLGRRKPLLLLGYGIGALSKPLFPLAGSVATVFFARFFDRIGKGIRGAPRDALVADLTMPEQRGAAYGVRQSLDTVGAVAGPLLAIVLMLVFAGDIRAVLWIAVIPAFAAVAILWLTVREPPQRTPSRRGMPVLRPGLLPRAFWTLAGVAGCFTLARFSEAFLILRGMSVGLPMSLAPVTLVVMSTAYMASAYPAGWLADRVPRTALLMLGCAVLVAANLVLAIADSAAVAFIGAALWGVHMGFTEGVFGAMVADSAPADLRGTAFGVFNLIRGSLLFVASVSAGVLWDQSGPQTTFLASAVLAGLALLLLMARRSASRGAA